MGKQDEQNSDKHTQEERHDVVGELDEVKHDVGERASALAPAKGEKKPGATTADIAKSIAEHEKDIPKQPGHLDTRRPNLQDLDEKT